MNLFNSGRLTLILFLVLLASLLVQYQIYAWQRSKDEAIEKWAESAAKARTLAHAIEEYCRDFPDAGPLRNDRTWTDMLGGNNSKNIRYLKIEKYSRDSDGRLLDACGAPYLIVVKGMPDFWATTPRTEDTEFHVVPGECGSPGIGNRTPN
jgi:hypothetical protein